jgi:hypothetical protein
MKTCILTALLSLLSLMALPAANSLSNEEAPKVRGLAHGSDRKLRMMTMAPSKKPTMAPTVKVCYIPGKAGTMKMKVKVPCGTKAPTIAPTGTPTGTPTSAPTLAPTTDAPSTVTPTSKPV